MRRTSILAILAFAALLWGCKGNLGVQTDDGSGSTDPPPGNNSAVEVNTDVTGVGVVGVRRMSRQEFTDSLFFLLGDTSDLAVRLPEDDIDPFDNDWEGQRVSQAMVEAVEAVAANAAQTAMADTERRDDILGCAPAGPDDEACFRSFIESFGRKALRRPLNTAEVDALMALQTFAVESGDFYEGARYVIEALLQMPDFVYHVHRGIPVDGQPGVYRLTQFEVASRLSFFLWGTPPDDALLDAASNDQLTTSEQVRAQAERMLQDERARERVHRFHALWLGYHRFTPNDSLGAAMEAETELLIDRVVFEEQGNYFDLFTTNETFINDELATHYGLEPPGSVDGTWVTYPADVDRGGILSHATFLGVASKFGDTSPTQRGRVIRERLLCTPIALPDVSLGVDVDAPPPATSPDDCKRDRYEAILAQDGCAVCHNQMDPIGLGLENYDQFGRFRTTDVDNANCTIDGTGELLGVGQFQGPRQLGELLAESGRMQTCVVDRLYQFATAAKPSATDITTLRALRENFQESGYRFDQLMLDMVSSEAFLYRRTPEVEP